MYTRSQTQQTNTTQNNKKTLHISKSLKLQNSKNPKIQQSKNPSIRKSENPKIQKSKTFFTSTESCIFFDFWIFGFLDFRSHCLVDKWAKCAFLRVVGGVSIYIYMYLSYMYIIYLMNIHIYLCTHTSMCV